jgi:hypothetical protein
MGRWPESRFENKGREHKVVDANGPEGDISGAAKEGWVFDRDMWGGTQPGVTTSRGRKFDRGIPARYQVRAREHGAGPHAIYCRDGKRGEPVRLEDGVVVEAATEADRAQVPDDLPPMLSGFVGAHSGFAISLVGVYRISGGEVIALYGCDLDPVPA